MISFAIVLGLAVLKFTPLSTVTVRSKGTYAYNNRSLRQNQSNDGENIKMSDWSYRSFVQQENRNVDAE